MSTLQMRNLERGILYNKENENIINKMRLSLEMEKNQKNSKIQSFEKFSSISIQTYLNSVVALQFHKMGSNIHPIHFQKFPHFRKETNTKEISDRKNIFLQERNLIQSQSEKNLPAKEYLLRRIDCNKDCNSSRIAPSEINFGESEKVLVNNILIERKKSAIIIQTFFRRSYAQKKIKLVYLIEKVLTTRKNSLKKLQLRVKGFLCRKNIRQILKMKEENYPIFYYKKNPKLMPKYEIKDVFMIVRQEKYNQVLNFKYNRYLDCFILFIKKNDSYNPKYKIVFVINGKKILDTVFDISYEKDGTCFNILDFKLIKKKGYISNIEEHSTDDSLDMEDLHLRRKMTLDSLPSAAESKLIKDFMLMKPCIKRSFDNIYNQLSPKKKVSFNLRMNNFY